MPTRKDISCIPGRGQPVQYFYIASYRIAFPLLSYVTDYATKMLLNAGPSAV
jgi:hypothetical protein